jgi:hypothetical protein
MAERCFNFAPDGWCDAWILRLMAVLFFQKSTADDFGLRQRGYERLRRMALGFDDKDAAEMTKRITM